MSGNEHRKVRFSAGLWATLLASGCAQILGLSSDYRERDDQARDASGDLDGAADAGQGMPFALPAGKLVYHRFSSYYAGDSEMFVVDLPSGTRSPEIGVTYGLCHPLNGIFSPDGQRLVVMAMPRGDGPCGETDRLQMDVYELDLTQPGQKAQITANDVPDEDPQYFADGSRLVFKHDGHLAEWPEGAEQFTRCDALPEGAICYTGEGEQSKPVVTPDGVSLCYYQGQNETADVYCVARLEAASGTPLEDVRKPAAVHRDILDSRPSITDGNLYYVRWRSVANQVGYIARKSLADLSGVGEDAPFSDDEGSDYNDPYGLGNDLVVFSSNQAGQGGHDLFVAQFSSSDLYSLDSFVPGLNSPLQDLGAAFWHQTAMD